MSNLRLCRTYDGVFLQKYLTDFSHELFLQKSSIVHFPLVHIAALRLHRGVFNVNFEHIHHFDLVYLLLKIKFQFSEFLFLVSCV